MRKTTHDLWAEWLLRRRFGGDPARMQTQMQELYGYRDRVLQNARLTSGEVLLDVGAGDGLIAFGALPFVGPSGRVIFSDISNDLLQHSRALAEQMGVAQQCGFLNAPAEDFSILADASVDVVTTRSVLIYVADKAKAFAEFYRVLKPGGRLSIFEPINRFMSADYESRFFGQDVMPIRPLADKVWAVFKERQPADSDPMLNFDEHDLFNMAERAGFAEVYLDFQAEIKPGGWWGTDWDSLLRVAGNPKIPTLGEAIAQALTPAEARTFSDYMRPRVESGVGKGRMAKAFLWAVKRGD